MFFLLQLRRVLLLCLRQRPLQVNLVAVSLNFGLLVL
jgi:hypothetical protein